MHPKVYTDKNIFEDEYNKIFSRSSFVCDEGLIEEQGSYYSSLNFGRPVTARGSDDGCYRLIDNVCLHRNNLIDPVGSGIRDFRCNYHGWSYSPDGSLLRAPLAKSDCLERKFLNSELLSKYQNLLFLDKTGFIKQEIDLLDELNYSDCGTFYRSELVHDANWKLLVENVVESYHISFVHAESFVSTGITSSSLNINKYQGRSSYFEIENKLVSPKEPPASPGSKNYKHVYIFPNLFISITAGMIGFMSHVVPISPEKSILRWRLFETKKMAGLKESVRKLMRDNSISFTNKVLGEDLVLLNNSQIGIAHSLSAHQLQDVEERLRHFQLSYESAMRGDE